MSGKILVTGSGGLVGSSIKEEVEKSNSSDHFVFVFRNDCDLREKSQVDFIFNGIKPKAVVHCAARVGGLLGNEAMHEEFFYDNILMNANVIRACCNHNVEQLFAFSSACVFPDELEILEEDKMHTGPVYESNFAYGYAKRMVDVHIRAAKKQYGDKNWCSVIPGNIYGKHDMFSVDHGHIIPSLIYKLYEAKKNETPFVIWGDGQSYREFIYVNDIAKSILALIGKSVPERIIMSGYEEVKIEDLVRTLCEVADYTGEVVYDTSKPNGQRRRPSSKKVFNDTLGEFQHTSLRDGLQTTWDWFVDNYPNVRSEY